jgi:hypothetical protein
LGGFNVAIAVLLARCELTDVDQRYGGSCRVNIGFDSRFYDNIVWAKSRALQDTLGLDVAGGWIDWNPRRLLLIEPTGLKETRFGIALWGDLPRDWVNLYHCKGTGTLGEGLLVRRTGRQIGIEYVLYGAVELSDRCT